MAADVLRREPNAAPDVESADALRRVELVRGHREQVAAEFLNVNLSSAEGLNRVGVQPEVLVSGGAPLAHERADFGDGLDGSNLVVGEHDCDEHRFGAEGRANVLDAHDAFVVDGQARYLPVSPFESLADAAHRRVLDCRSDDVATALGGSFGDAADGEVVGLRAAGEEDDFVGARVDERGYFAARAVDGGARLLAEEVYARRVAELLGQ